LRTNNGSFRGSNYSGFCGFGALGAFFLPDMAQWFVIHAPTFSTQQVLCVSPITWRMFARERAQARCKTRSKCVLNKISLLRASMLANNATCSSLQDVEEIGDVLD
jgi:hypothetical protein